MEIQRIASFSNGTQGGNPAGVVILDHLPAPDVMQQVAKDVGYSETAFAAPSGDGFEVRYFAPSMEVPFCGHATIALGAALGRAFGAGVYPLALSQADITVEAVQNGDTWGARLTSPSTSQSKIPKDDLTAILDMFGWTKDDLGALAPTYANAGADHALLFLDDLKLLQHMSYDFDEGLALMTRLKLVTINCLYRERDDLFHSRNAFASGGVVEDPATGAAAALGGYLRDAGILETPFEVIQGVDMGAPSRLMVAPLLKHGSGILVSGMTRMINDT